MPHINPLPRTDVPELEPLLRNAEAAMGFVPNSMLTMAHLPQLTMAFSLLAGVCFGTDIRPQVQALASLSPQPQPATAALPGHLVQLIAYCASLSSGCRYCQAHTSHNGHRQGLTSDQLDEILTYEQSDQFTAAEKALIDLALAAGSVPNGATPLHFEVLRQHYSEQQCVQIVAVIALFGFLNRWNDTLATSLEAAPTEFAQTMLADAGWQIGKHGP